MKEDLKELKIITEYTRAARTDKGVRAQGNIISLKIRKNENV